MNRNTVVAVHAYSGDLNQVVQNLPLYVHHGCPVVVLSPEDAPIKSVSSGHVRCLVGGRKGWIGPQTLERELIHFRMLLENFPQEHFLLNDADSFCLSRDIPQYCYDDPRIFWSNEVLDTNPSPSMLPKLAFQPPYFVHRETLKAMLAVQTLPTSYYGPDLSPEGTQLPFPTGCIDHFLMQLVFGANLAHFNFHTGASFETESEHGLETMAYHVRHLGRVMLHSVKSKRALDRIVGEYQAAKLG